MTKAVTLEDFLSMPRHKLSRVPIQDRLSAMRSAVTLPNSSEERLRWLSVLGLADPMKMGSENNDGTGTNYIGRLLSKLVGLEKTQSPSKIQSGLFSLYGSFAEYVAQCYDSDYKERAFGGNQADYKDFYQKAKESIFENESESLQVT